MERSNKIQMVPLSIANEAKKQAKKELKQTVRQMLLSNLSRNGDNYASSTTSNNWNHASVANYLRNHGFDYTLSVFMTESDVAPDSKLLSTKIDSISNFDTNKITLQVWENLERKYNSLLKKKVIEMEHEVASQVQQIESILRRKIQQEETTLRKLYGRKIDELEAKEREMNNIFERRQQNAETVIESEKKELLRQIKEMDVRRRELGKVESRLAKQIETEMTNLREMREELTNFEAEIRRRELEVDLILQQRTKRILEEQESKYMEKLRDFKSREETFRKILENLKGSSSEIESLQFLLTEKDRRILEIQATNETLKRENGQLVQQLLVSNEKLKEISDSANNFNRQENAKLLEEMERLNELLRTERHEFKIMQRQYQSEVKQLQFELSAAQSMISGEDMDLRNKLQKKLEDVGNELQQQNAQWIDRFNEQKLRYDELKKHWQFENERTRHLTEEINQLRKKNVKNNILRKSARFDNNRLVVSNLANDRGFSDDETSRDSPPDFIKDAQSRLKQLEEEAKDFDTALYRYRLKEMNLSAKSLQNSAGLSDNRRSDSFFINGYREASDSYRKPSDLSPPPLLVASQMRLDVRHVEQKAKEESVAADAAKITVTAVEKPASSVDVATRTTVVEDDPDEWETRLKARREERQRRDEEIAKKREEDLKNLQQQSQQTPSIPSSSKQPTVVDSTVAGDAGASSLPAVDPVMQKYMEMVAEQKRQQQIKRSEPAAAPTPDIPVRNEAEAREDVEVASLERPSSSEFEW